MPWTRCQGRFPAGLPVGVGRHGPLVGNGEPSHFRVKPDNTITSSAARGRPGCFTGLSRDEERTVLVPWLRSADRQEVREGLRHREV